MSRKPEPTHSYKTFNRLVFRREAVEALTRLLPLGADPGQVERFSTGVRIEHFILTVTVFGLALTGLAQTFEGSFIARQLLFAMGGLNAAQQVHHILGLTLDVLVIYHALILIDGLFVRRRPGKMMPEWNDLANLGRLIGFALGFSKKQPLYDRYSLDEKVIYWLSATSLAVLVVTGFVLRYPTWITQVLPGGVFPFAVVFHRWQAILLVAVVILLHGYQVLLRGANRSMFTGKISLDEMQVEHPVELAYLEQAAATVKSKPWPQRVKFTIDEFTAQKVLTAIEKKPAPVIEMVIEPLPDTFTAVEPVKESQEETIPEAVEPSVITNPANGEFIQG
ncbi:MAG TPA: cytochrome b/b6 domain-containing protein [Anaerolineales bacterium]|jgi:formate dehydrogenase gamma subunit